MVIIMKEISVLPQKTVKVLMVINALVYQVTFFYWRSVAQTGLYGNVIFGIFIAISCFYLFKRKRWAIFFYYFLSVLAIIYTVTALLVLIRKTIGPAFQDIPTVFLLSYFGVAFMHVITLIILKKCGFLLKKGK